MANAQSDLLTAGKIAQQLGVSGSVISKAIKTLNLQPDLVKSGCKYYGKETIAKVRKALK